MAEADEARATIGQRRDTHKPVDGRCHDVEDQDRDNTPISLRLPLRRPRVALDLKSTMIGPLEVALRQEPGPALDLSPLMLLLVLVPLLRRLFRGRDLFLPAIRVEDMVQAVVGLPSSRVRITSLPLRLRHLHGLAPKRRSSITFCFLTRFLRISSFDFGGGACFRSPLCYDRPVARWPQHPWTRRFQPTHLSSWASSSSCPDRERRRDRVDGVARASTASRRVVDTGAAPSSWTRRLLDLLLLPRRGRHLLVVIGVEPQVGGAPWPRAFPLRADTHQRDTRLGVTCSRTPSRPSLNSLSAAASLKSSSDRPSSCRPPIPALCAPRRSRPPPSAAASRRQAGASLSRHVPSPSPSCALRYASRGPWPPSGHHQSPSLLLGPGHRFSNGLKHPRHHRWTQVMATLHDGTPRADSDSSSSKSESKTSRLSCSDSAEPEYSSSSFSSFQKSSISSSSLAAWRSFSCLMSAAIAPPGPLPSRALQDRRLSDRCGPQRLGQIHAQGHVVGP